MISGFAYVLHEHGDFAKRMNTELMGVLPLAGFAIQEERRCRLITEHVHFTGSHRGEELLANWPGCSGYFTLVKPKSSDVKELLGQRNRSAAELRVQAQ